MRLREASRARREGNAADPIDRVGRFGDGKSRCPRVSKIEVAVCVCVPVPVFVPVLKHAKCLDFELRNLDSEITMTVHSTQAFHLLISRLSNLQFVSHVHYFKFYNIYF